MTDGFEIANALKNHFSKVGENISMRFDEPHNLPPIIAPRSATTFNLPNIKPDKIIELCKNLKVNLKQCLLCIPSQIIKRFITYLSEPLTHCITINIDEDKFANILKAAVISPLAKKDDPTDPLNRRPISSLSFFSTLFESYIYYIYCSFFGHCESV